MNKNNILKILCHTVFIFILTESSLSSAETSKLIVKAGDSLVISPRKIGPGNWSIKSYDKRILNLVEDIKKPFPSFIFKTLMPASTLIELRYRIKNKFESKLYRVVVEEKSVPTNASKQIAYIKNNKYNLSSIHGTKSFIKDEKTYFEYIYKLYGMKLYKESLSGIKYFEANFELSDKIQKLYMLKSDIFVKLNKIHEAISTYNHMIKASSLPHQQVDILFILGELHKANKNSTKAKEIFANILVVSKKARYRAKAYLKLGELYFEEKNYYKAMNQFKRIITRFPEAKKLKEKALYLIATNYYENENLKDYYLAYKYFKVLKEEYPYGDYSRKINDKIEYIESNFIDFF